MQRITQKAKQALSRKGLYLLGGTAGLFASASVMAQTATTGPDLTALTDAVDFTTVITAILAVAASLMGLYMAWKGAQFVIRAVRGA
ncbi:hypothetical protein LL240_17200 [Oceanimonas baumannii]|uniref:hypothetical protein n=1 Tax=Oceanimonas baumannii TaxID=129578 RepID=UPI001D197AC6|nr:hypothetical protein [Oceanimonas baumannii]MCC4266173.1 hypothetical protein [Oceanimonas baumannii]